MSQAEDLLNSIDEENISTYTTDPLTEEHIIIGPDRFIKVPEPLKRIAVQYDHDVETVTFDCPRYWDNHDLSTMYIYINYIRDDAVKGAYLAKNVSVDEVDENIIHFEWTISQEITLIEGKINFLVCAIKTDEEGFQEIHWNSEINSEMFVSKGLEAGEVILEKYPDIINDLLTRMDQILIGDGTVIDTTLTQPGIAADSETVGKRFEGIDTQINDINNGINDINNVLENEVLYEEVDPTVPDWAKQPEKPTYNHNELTDGDTLAVKNGTLQTNLNAQMVGGKKVEELIDHYYTATIENRNKNFTTLNDVIFKTYTKTNITSAMTDNSTSTYYTCTHDTDATNVICKLVANGTRKIKITKWKYAFSGGYSSSSAVTCKLQASNDNSTWTDLDSVMFTGSTTVNSNLTSGAKDITNTTFFKYIRLISVDTRTNDNLYGKIYTHTFNLEGVENSDILKVDMPINDVMRIIIPAANKDTTSFINIRGTEYYIRDLIVGGAKQRFYFSNNELRDYTDVVYGTYTGIGVSTSSDDWSEKNTQYITLGFRPSAVYVSKASYIMEDFSLAVLGSNIQMSSSDGVAYYTLQITDNGFRVDWTNNSGNITGLNGKSSKYNYIAFR